MAYQGNSSACLFAHVVQCLRSCVCPNAPIGSACTGEHNFPVKLYKVLFSPFSFVKCCRFMLKYQ
jgi:hypothetical protein